MIIDAVEYHEDSLPEGVDWRAAAALLATFFVWAKDHDAIVSDAFGSEYARIVSEIGDPSVRPSDWVSNNIDYKLSDQLFSESVAARFLKLVDSGEFYRDVTRAAGDLYGLPDSWQGLKPAVELLDKAMK